MRLKLLQGSNLSFLEKSRALKFFKARHLNLHRLSNETIYAVQSRDEITHSSRYEVYCRSYQELAHDELAVLQELVVVVFVAK